MKRNKQLLSLIASAAALVLTLPVPAARAASVPYSSPYTAEEHSATARCNTAEEAAAVLREKLREHETEFSIPVLYNLAGSKAKVDAIIEAAVAETSSGSEGDYIRYSFDAYGYSTEPDWLTRTTQIAFTVAYNTTAEQEKVLDLKVREILDRLNVYDAPDIVKISSVYDYVVRNTTYSQELTDNVIFSAYGAAVNGDAVCQGYSQLIYRLLKDLGVSCRIIPGSSEEVNHAWNLVGINGTYYYLDATWESLLGSSDYVFFLRGSEDFDSIPGFNTHSFKAMPHESTPLNEEADSGRLLSQYRIAKYKYNREIRSSLGDVTGDGAIDAADATMILQAYANMSVGKANGLSEEQAADADADGDSFITPSDATLVLKYYTYLSTTVKPVDFITYVNDEK